MHARTCAPACARCKFHAPPAFGPYERRSVLASCRAMSPSASTPAVCHTPYSDGSVCRIVAESAYVSVGWAASYLCTTTVAAPHRAAVQVEPICHAGDEHHMRLAAPSASQPAVSSPIPPVPPVSNSVDASRGKPGGGGCAMRTTTLPTFCSFCNRRKAAHGPRKVEGHEWQANHVTPSPASQSLSTPCIHLDCATMSTSTASKS